MIHAILADITIFGDGKLKKEEILDTKYQNFEFDFFFDVKWAKESRLINIIKI